MLLYLANNSRPDIAYAVHQVARFSHFPKQSHGRAIKQIVRYLKGTRTRGLIMRPTDALNLDCYVDADFAGLWGSEDDQDSLSARFRTGYVLTLGGCPLTWCSTLQIEIALSTMEAEYIALSHSMRDLLLMQRLLVKVNSALGLPQVTPISTVYEDNDSALTLLPIFPVSLLEANTLPSSRPVDTIDNAAGGETEEIVSALFISN
jgi:hypothetical protein